jgi:two-component system, cell cycle sensor histidine kinase and response regulator CckA
VTRYSEEVFTQRKMSAPHPLQSILTAVSEQAGFRRLIDSNIVGVGFWDRDHVITEANDALLRILGRTPGDTTPILLADLAGGRALAEIRERGICEIFQCDHLDATGEKVTVLVGGATLSEGTGLVYALEVGERKRLEDERKRLEEERKRLEEERKRLEEKLRQTAKLESLGILAGGIAHDFNNLLTGILGNASLALEEAAPGSGIAELLRSMVQATERAAALAYQMLAYSGRGQFRLEYVNLSALVSETLTLIESALGKAIRLNLAVAPALPLVHGDPSQLQQIAMNLAINAAEAVDNKGEVSVRTGIAELDGTRHANDVFLMQGIPPPAGKYVFLEVRDSGAGMDAETLQRIFDPFFTTKSTGRGLGLAAVLGIVRSHQGTMRISSSPGRGTTFTVYLPACESGPSDTESETQPHRPSGGIVLVVDDEHYVRETVRRTLELAGYTVVCASGSAEAMQLFQSLGRQIELAIVDLTMPGESGGDVARRLRHHDPDLKVIASSGYAEAEVKAGFGGLMDAFLPKPYRSDQLRDIVATVLAA